MTRAACLDTLVTAIVSRKLTHPTRVAIDGVDGSGKTTLADELVEPIRKTGREVVRASVDGFHHPRSVRYGRGPDSPEGYFQDSFDYVALKRVLLDPLGPKGDRRFRTAVFDYRADRAVDAPLRVAGPTAVVLFDGVFLQRPELEGSWDIAIWLDVGFGVTVERAVVRDAQHGGDAAGVRAKYAARYVPGQRLYLEQCRPHERADIVVSNAILDRPRVRVRERVRA